MSGEEVEGKEEEKALRVGRLLATVAKKDRDLYESVKAVARRKGKKVSEVLTEALEIWQLYSTLEEVDPKALVAAIYFVKDMMKFTVSLLAEVGTVFVSDFIQSQLEAVQELAAQYRQTQPQMQASATQSGGERPSVADQMKEAVKMQLYNALLPLLINTLNNLLRALGGAQIQLPISAPTASTPTSTVRVEE